MKIKSLPVEQNGTILYIGAIKVRDLTGHVKVDMRSSKEPEGYQRECSPTRARSFGRFIARAKGISPNSLLLNVRRQDSLKYKDGVLTIDDNEPLWLVDGQHRVKGLEMVMDEDDDPTISDFELPVVILNEPDRYKEAKQFWIVNKTQKGVRSDLAERILQRVIYKEGKQSLVHLSEQGVLGPLLKGFEWKDKAVHIADILNTRADSPLRGMIRMPGDSKSRDSILTQTSVTSSLEPVLKDGFFTSKERDSIVQVLVNYWNAAKNTWPEIFTDPTGYALLKTTGFHAMHILLPVISSYSVDSEGKRVLTKEAIRTIFAKLAASGVTEEFWSNNGEAGKFGSGKKSQKLLAEVLIDKLREELGETSDMEV